MEMRDGFQPLTPDFAARAAAGFAAQPAMATIGARLVRVAPGETEIEFAHRPELAQQHGFLHAGIVTAAVDSACGFAAYSLMPADAEVLTVEFKVNLLAPAQGDSYRAIGKVIKPGRTLTVCLGEVYALQGESERLIATMMATMIALRK